LQAALGGPGRPDERPPSARRLDAERPIAIVADRAGRWRPRFEAAGWTVAELSAAASAPDALRITEAGGADPVVLLGDVEDWQSRWGALSALRGRCSIVFAGCAIAEVRTLSRSRRIPPPLAIGQGWELDDEGGFRRVRLP